MLIASYLEPQFVAQIRQQDGIRVAYEAGLVPRPRYPSDHVGHPLRRGAEDEARWRGLLADAEVLFDFDYPNLNDLRTLIPRVRSISREVAQKIRNSENVPVPLADIAASPLGITITRNHSVEGETRAIPSPILRGIFFGGGGCPSRIRRRPTLLQSMGAG